MGVHTMPREEYDQIQAENWSKLKHLARSPAAYSYRAANPEHDTAARKVGRAVHLAVLEPERFADSVAIWDGGRRYGKEWNAFVSANAGKELLKRDEFRQCMALQTAVRSDPVAAPHLMRGAAEQTVLWTDEVTGIKCKARTDWLNDVLADLKTTRDASPDGFARESWQYRYHTQLAFYSDGLRAAGERERPVLIIAVESAPPYPVVVYRLGEELLQHGREEYRELLSRLKGLRELGPEAFATGYATCELDLALPRWMRHDEDGDLEGLGLEFGDEDNDDQEDA